MRLQQHFSHASGECLNALVAFIEGSVAVGPLGMTLISVCNPRNTR